MNKKGQSVILFLIAVAIICVIIYAFFMFSTVENVTYKKTCTNQYYLLEYNTTCQIRWDAREFRKCDNGINYDNINQWKTISVCE